MGSGFSICGVYPAAAVGYSSKCLTKHNTCGLLQAMITCQSGHSVVVCVCLLVTAPAYSS